MTAEDVEGEYIRNVPEPQQFFRTKLQYEYGSTSLPAVAPNRDRVHVFVLDTEF